MASRLHARARTLVTLATVVACTSAQLLPFTQNYVGDVEADMTVPQIIRRWDYKGETHTATTSDGYVLELHRIGQGRHGRRTSRQPSLQTFVMVKWLYEH